MPADFTVTSEVIVIVRFQTNVSLRPGLEIDEKANTREARLENMGALGRVSQQMVAPSAEQCLMVIV